MESAEAIRSMLTDCDDPVAAIEAFQKANTFSTPAIDSALPLLDLLGTSRYTFHLQVLLKFTEALLAKIPQLSEEKKAKLLADMLPCSEQDAVQTLLKELLLSFKSVPAELLGDLAKNPRAYACCPIRVKRCIWEGNTDLFLEEVRDLCKKYVAEKDVSLLSLPEPETAFFDVAPRTRRQHPVMTELVDMVGTSQKLYETVCESLRLSFGQHQNLHYCTLRNDVLMALHEAGHIGLTRQDECHKFIWCLDACVREHNIDEKRVKELSTCVNQHEDAIGEDMAMAAREPSVLHLLCGSAVSLIGDLAKHCKLPRESTTLKVLLRLLNISLTSMEAIQESSSEQSMDPDVIHRHMSILVNVCADMDGIALHTTLQFETGSSDEDFYLQTIQPLPASFPKVLISNSVVLVLTIHLAARTAKRGCSKSLQRLIHSLASALHVAERSLPVPCTVWYHFFREISKLSEMVLLEDVLESLGSGCLSLFIMVNLILPLCKNNADSLGQCLRTLLSWPASARNAIVAAFHESWLETLQPGEQHSPSVWELYSSTFAAFGWPVVTPAPPVQADEQGTQ